MWKYVHQSVYVYICLGMVCAESARWIKECYGKWKRPVREKGQLGWLWHLGSGGNFSNLSAVRLLVTCSQLDLDDFALPSVYSLSNHCPDGASPARVKDRKQSRNQRYSSDIHFYVTELGLMVWLSNMQHFTDYFETESQRVYSTCVCSLRSSLSQSRHEVSWGIEWTEMLWSGSSCRLYIWLKISLR